MLIIGSLGGYAAHKISWLPSITGFMLVGFLAGPSGLGLLTYHMISEARILIDIALALILYRLGLSLDLKMLWRSPGLLFASLLESIATFAAVYFLLSLFGIPKVLAVLIAAISISSSPAVLLHVAHEVNAKGVATETAKTLVAMNNLLSFVAFSAALSMLLFSSGFNWSTVFFQPLYTLLGSTLLGVVLGLSLHAIAQRTHSATQYKLALVIGTIMVAIGLANELKLSMLFCALVIGIVVKSIERESKVSDIQFGPSFELFFIVLFVFAGAGLHLKELLDYAPLVLALVVARSLAKVLGVAGITALYRRPLRKGAASGMLLIPMAGLAIGLALTASNMFPEHATMISAIVLGSVAVFETMGPPIATFAFRFAGEANEGGEAPKSAVPKTSTAKAQPVKAPPAKSEPAKPEVAKSATKNSPNNELNPAIASLKLSTATAQVASPEVDVSLSSREIKVNSAEAIGAAAVTVLMAATEVNAEPEPEAQIGLVSPSQVVKNKVAAPAAAVSLSASAVEIAPAVESAVVEVAAGHEEQLEGEIEEHHEEPEEEKPINQLFHEEHELPDDEAVLEEGAVDEQELQLDEQPDTQLAVTDLQDAELSGPDLVDRALNSLSQTPAGRIDVFAPQESEAQAVDAQQGAVAPAAPVAASDAKLQPLWHKAAQKTKQLFEARDSSSDTKEAQDTKDV
jgi:Kef-type K+ transport system membrane component KefB